MRAPSNLQLAGTLFLISIAVFVLIITHKKSTATELPNSDNTVAQYIQTVEQQEQQARDEKEQADKRAKLTKAKQDSAECQFWKQQKQNKSTNPRIGEKIAQFCELALEQTSSSVPPTNASL
jgi:ribosome assembly protein YihI (activator of Der GTPase)